MIKKYFSFSLIFIISILLMGCNKKLDCKDKDIKEYLKNLNYEYSEEVVKIEDITGKKEDYPYDDYSPGYVYEEYIYYVVIVQYNNDNTDDEFKKELEYTSNAFKDFNNVYTYASNTTDSSCVTIYLCYSNKIDTTIISRLKNYDDFCSLVDESKGKSSGFSRSQQIN